jgi:hypothetical protein
MKTFRKQGSGPSSPFLPVIKYAFASRFDIDVILRQLRLLHLRRRLGFDRLSGLRFMRPRMRDGSNLRRRGRMDGRCAHCLSPFIYGIILRLIRLKGYKVGGAEGSFWDRKDEINASLRLTFCVFTLFSSLRA